MRLNVLTLNRSLSVPGLARPWRLLFAGLASGNHMAMGVFGSSIAQNAGCTSQPGKRCMAHGFGVSKGFAVSFLDHINLSWPHADHEIYNAGMDGTAMQTSLPCLFTHVPQRLE